MALYIPLSGCQVTFVDDRFASLRRYHWRLNRDGYVVRSTRHDGKSITIYLHRHVMSATQGQRVDHVDRDKLNNTRQNLRFATASQSQFNRGVSQSSHSGIKGVNFVNLNILYWKISTQLLNHNIACPTL